MGRGGGMGGGKGGAKEKQQKILSAYPLLDQPMGTSVPFMPQSRPWNARTVNAPALGERRDRGMDATAMSTTGTSEAGDDVSTIFGKASESVTKEKTAGTGASRPTASVTDIPGASAPAKRVFEQGNLKKAGKAIRGNQKQQRAAMKQMKEENDQPVHHFTFPAAMWFGLGVICPPLLLCGCRYISSGNFKAKVLGWASLFLLGMYCTAGLIVGAALWRPDAWTGEDPACIQYLMGVNSQLNNELGKAVAVYGFSGPGLVTASNISLYKVNCSWVGQVTVEASESIVAGSTNAADKPPRTLVVRMVTPGTTGNDFGLYVRARDSKINPSVDVAPSKSWFAQSDPYLSNPYSASDPKFGQRPPCLTGRCDGVYGSSLAVMTGSQYESKINLEWYKYYMVIGVFGLGQLSLERPFCVDTCLLTWTRSSDGKSWEEPCKDTELTVCPAAANCVIAKTRLQCLSSSFARRGGDGQGFVGLTSSESEALERIEEKAKVLERQSSPVWG